MRGLEERHRQEDSDRRLASALSLGLGLSASDIQSTSPRGVSPVCKGVVFSTRLTLTSSLVCCSSKVAPIEGRGTPGRVGLPGKWYFALQNGATF